MPSYHQILLMFLGIAFGTHALVSPVSPISQTYHKKSILQSPVEHQHSVSIKAPLQKINNMLLDVYNFPQWMPWLKSVEKVEDTLQWKMSYNKFGFTWRYNWTTALPEYCAASKTITWFSIDGLLNEGSLNFSEIENAKGVKEVKVQMSIAVQPPQNLASIPFSRALMSRVLKSIIQNDLSTLQRTLEQ